MAGATTSRGYGWREHQQARARWKPTVDAGQAWCAEAVCLKRSRWIEPGTPWDLSHTPDRGGHLGPSHAACNRAEGGRRGARARAHKPRRKRRPPIPAGPLVTSRDW